VQELIISQEIGQELTEETLPMAVVQGQTLLAMPNDLYIPPDALRVFLEAFEGPLDLLLYLIKRQNIDILDIPIAEITRQYMEYVEIMREVHFELAAEYLLMAAMLAEIKSRMLLPRPEHAEENEEDPRAELVRRLQEYEQFKQAAENLDALPCEGRDVFNAQVEIPEIKNSAPPPHVDLRDLLLALRDVMQRADRSAHHQVRLEPLSVRERMSIVLGLLDETNFVEFAQFFAVKEGRLGVVVTFLALLELLKQALIELVQNEPYSPIYVKKIVN
jgi:segregation and condensation protein A